MTPARRAARAAFVTRATPAAACLLRAPRVTVHRCAFQTLSLFENRYADPKKAAEIVGCKEHQELLAELAEKSISVLKEENLPLALEEDKKIAVISVEPQKIAAAMDEKQCVDMLEKEIKAIHKNTCGIVVKLDPDEDDIARAVKVAKDADIIVVGLCSAIIFKKQAALYEALKELNKQMVVVAMYSPCDIELVPDCTDYITTYGAARDWMRVAAKRMFGLTDVNAKMPIDL